MTTPEAYTRDTSDGSGSLPDADVLLRQTDWAALDFAFEPEVIDVADALTKLFDENADVRARALRDLKEAANHQNTIYPATPSVALYIAAVLPDDRTEATGRYGEDDRIRPLRAALIDWLRVLAYDVDDSSVAAAQRHGFGVYPAQAELRALRPTLFHAVMAFVDDSDVDVRHTAITTALVLLDTPQEHARHRAELAKPVADLLATSTNWYHRAQALDALDAWGEDTVTLRQTEPPRPGIRRAEPRS
ncbi:hypothetical protein [Actinoallomurus sp. NPDC050550]|uniref:hypothetical protein n=1 Tax=Actinoallomurus sp. NPDC050550 TaxID=3154937 RepID=UPI00340596B9